MQINYENHECQLCGYIVKNCRSLGNHVGRSHKLMKTQEYILQFFYKNIIPKCACGCGKETRWHKTQYEYNEYLNGHNHRFSSTNQPKLTEEQVAKRNNAIRAAYEERKDEICNKISKAVGEAFKEPETKKRLVDGQKRVWSNPEYKKRMSKVRKKVWAEQYDDLCKKIFTEDMRKKIAETNMKRDFKRTSAAEKHFIDNLRIILSENVVDSFWLNKEKVKCFDAYIPSENLLIEFDGIFYHGHDRKTNFTCLQIWNMANDFIKNKLALDNKFNFIRIKEDINLDQITDVTSLIASAYHYQKADGTVERDGSFKFTDDDHSILEREELIRFAELEADTYGKEYIESELLPAIFAFYRAYVLWHGWFYPSSSETLQCVISKLRERRIDISKREISSLGNIGSNYLKSLFKSYWDVSDGPSKKFWNDKSLKNVLRYRLSLNKSKMYHYVLQDGTEIDCNETFDINIKNIRYGFIVQRAAVSWFKSSAYSEILARYIPEQCDKPVIWDPSCGFGARLLSFIAHYPEGTYIGTDPSSEVQRDLKLLKQLFLDEKIIERAEQIQLHMCGSEEIKLNQQVDLVSTSPPYFDLEKYIDEETQCYVKYSDESSWYNNYIIPTFITAYNALKINRYMVININKTYKDMIIRAALSVGFKCEDELKLITGRDHFGKAQRITTQNYEPILIFKK